MTKFRQKLIDFKSKLQDRHIYSATLIVLAIISAIAIYQYKRSVDYKNLAESNYQRAFFEMSDYINNVDTSLAKVMLSRDPKQLSALSVELFRNAAFAQSSLGQLPLNSVDTENIAKYLTQVGDYTYSLSRKVSSGEYLSDEDRASLKTLADYSTTINTSVQQIESELASGVIHFGDTKKASASANSQSPTFNSEMEKLQAEFSNYPSLIYDGPFSQHMYGREAIFIKDKADVSVAEAEAKLRAFMRLNNDVTITLGSEVAGSIPAYSFDITLPDDDAREISATVTKRGGEVLMVLDNRTSENANLNAEQAEIKAQEFLDSSGIIGMAPTYFEVQNNTVLVNFAYKYEQVTYYPDLIKVRVALDDGGIIGYEAHSYIMNHYQRSLATPILTQEDARAKMSSDLKIDNIKLAVIPDDSGTELLCYEIRGNVADHNYLVYIDALTGAERKILVLIESEDGTLTM
ncbi:MAG: germination protein YpeB [Clostridiales bacterium]|jgi:germination protein YpeB|nr:germination protein YpeB [Clostridiales bacterium]